MTWRKRTLQKKTHFVVAFHLTGVEMNTKGEGDDRAKQMNFMQFFRNFDKRKTQDNLNDTVDIF